VAPKGIDADNAWMNDRAGECGCSEIDVASIANSGRLDERASDRTSGSDLDQQPLASVVDARP
jgi:hypothetical protein